MPVNGAVHRTTFSLHVPFSFPQCAPTPAAHMVYIGLVIQNLGVTLRLRHPLSRARAALSLCVSHAQPHNHTPSLSHTHTRAHLFSFSLSLSLSLCLSLCVYVCECRGAHPILCKNRRDVGAHSGIADSEALQRWCEGMTRTIGAVIPLHCANVRTEQPAGTFRVRDCEIVDGPCYEVCSPVWLVIVHTLTLQ